MNEVLAGRRMLPGDRVYRILWVLGTDRLRAVCHCSAEREFDDPAELWEWLLAHPAGHGTAPVESPPSPVCAGVLAWP
ncbi:MAG: hypothetical protein ACLP8X_41155 [Streptosporangiaceae bacterium]